MKKYIKPFNTKIIVLMLFLFLGMGVFAQIPLPGTGDGNNDVNDEPAAPISSLVVVGLLAGAAIGYKKLK